jgi:hypothetical protein
VDYCCNPQWNVCGGNSDSPTPFRVCFNYKEHNECGIKLSFHSEMCVGEQWFPHTI